MKVCVEILSEKISLLIFVIEDFVAISEQFFCKFFRDLPVFSSKRQADVIFEACSIPLFAPPHYCINFGHARKFFVFFLKSPDLRKEKKVAESRMHIAETIKTIFISI